MKPGMNEIPLHPPFNVFAADAVDEDARDACFNELWVPWWTSEIMNGMMERFV